MALATEEDALVRLKPIVYDPREDDLVSCYLIDYLADIDSAFVTLNLYYTDVMEQQEFKDHLENSSFRAEGETLEEILPFPRSSFFWATGPEIGILGPQHIDFRERVEMVWDEWRREFRNAGKQSVKNSRIERHTLGLYSKKRFTQGRLT